MSHEIRGSETPRPGAGDPAADAARLAAAARSTHAAATFVDSAGVQWAVRAISNPAIAAMADRKLARPEFKSGWLLFESTFGKRRLAPYPADWESLPPEELERLLGEAR